MAQTAKNVVFSKPKASGASWSAPEGTALPKDAVTALSSDYVSHGYISEDGVAEGHSLSSETVKDYGKSTVLVVDGGDEVTVEVTYLEYTNPNVQIEAFGKDNVGLTDGALASVKVTDDAKEIRVHVFEHVLSNGLIERDVLPRAKVTNIDTITYSGGAALGVKVTYTAMADDDGVKIAKYFASVKE